MTSLEKGKVLSLNVSSVSGKKLPTFELGFFKGEKIVIFSINYLKEENLHPADLKGFVEDITIKGDLFPNVGDFLKIGELVVKIRSIGSESIINTRGRYGIVKKYGLWAEVLKEGRVKIGDEVFILERLNVGVIVASDKGSRGERKDVSGKILEEKILEIGGEVTHYAIVPDELETITEKIKEFVEAKCDLILTSGGTGWSKRDVTPEATRRVIEREVPGIPEIMRIEGYKSTPFAALSRAIAGIVGETLIINLPGSPKGVAESLDIIMPLLLHGIRVLKGRDKECGKIK
ncbi:MAG: molybdopterin-binding protein [Synergistetes bacterium]|nr:molybdopterin-binding protein [Synergistota bacterium]MCX8128209.1 molybdopterin-binding protein [Synergistota bacterium]MDW8192656.1 molybdopterin-binding protein [Synergistota bacterium]